MSAESLGRWKFEDARARLSEVVSRAENEGPQHISVQGRDAVVVVAADEYARLRGGHPTGADLLSFLQSTGLREVVPERDPEAGREVQLPW